MLGGNCGIGKVGPLTVLWGHRWQSPPRPLLLLEAEIFSSVADYHACGGRLTDDYGTIFTYKGPKTECVWTLQVDPKYKLLVSIPTLK